MEHIVNFSSKDQEEQARRGAVITRFNREMGPLNKDSREGEEKGKDFTDEEAGVILQYIFGNIALYGTSINTVFLPTKIICKRYVDEPTSKTLITFKLDTVAAMIRSVSDESTDPLVDGSTFRQLCTPFAVEARRFLVHMERVGVFTNLYVNHPVKCADAPQVAYDFNSGLHFRGLTKAERKVVEELNKIVNIAGRSDRLLELAASRVESGI
ncbi:coat protein [Phlomis mottle virus]|uniref:Coat protein n=1 Tax=Phlomis mottle virus TaxID=487095 RepID=A9JQJ7_9VIRU|nr:coat protein [Phlomis mottle virus]CAP46905.1 coat protein [Phlomis mottle virus]